MVELTIFGSLGRLLRVQELQSIGLRAYIDGKNEPFRRPSDMDEE